MLLRSSLSPAPPTLPSVSYAQSHHLSPFCLLKFGENHLIDQVTANRLYVCQSASQVHRHGNIDYENKPPLLWSSLYRRLLNGRKEGKTVADLLESWDGAERRINKWEVCRIAKELRKYRHYFLALEIYNWMEAQQDRFQLKSADMAIQLDLIGKVRGTLYAEKYFSSLSDFLKDKRTYCSLLNMYAQSEMKEKAESIFHLMQKKGYAQDTLSYNVMMTLYLNIGEPHNVQILVKEMNDKKIPRDIYSYNIWISNMTGRKDLSELEKILEIMDSDNVKPNWTTYTTLASMYIKFGLVDKAEDCIKEAESRMTGRNRSPFHYFMHLYGSIGKKDEVYRIWNWYKTSFPSPLNTGYKKVLQALLKAECIEGAEQIYEEWLDNSMSYDPRLCQILMGWYCDNRLANKAKETLDRLIERGGKPNSYTWEMLVHGYAKEQNVSESLVFLEKAVLAAVNDDEGIKWRPKSRIIRELLANCMGEKESLDKVANLLKLGGWSENEPFNGLIRDFVGFRAAK